MSLLALTVLFCLTSFTNAFPTDDCCGDLGSFTRVTISGCDDSDNPCTLHKGRNATIDIYFTSNEVTTDLKAVVHGTVLIVPVPFHLPHPDACQDANSGIACPLEKGKSYHYTTTLPVQARYPSVSVQIKWQLQDKDGNDIVCFELPAQIR